jgi:hypothetical protein
MKLSLQKAWFLLCFEIPKKKNDLMDRPNQHGGRWHDNHDIVDEPK